MDSNALFAVALLIVGLAILVAEIFVPSGGLLGVITFLSLIVSLVFAYRAWGISHPNVFVGYCVLTFLLVPTVIGTGIYLLPRTPFGKRVLLEAPTSDEVTPYLEESRRLEKLVGQYGTTLSMLNPGGMVNIEGQRFHAISDGLSIDAGVSVQVIDLQGINVIVRQGNPPLLPPVETANPIDELSEEMDFDYPLN